MQDVFSTVQAVAPDLNRLLRTRVDILQVLQATETSIGRKFLADRVKLTERSLRSIIDMMKDQGLVSIDKRGISLTQHGQITAEIALASRHVPSRRPLVETRLKEVLGMQEVWVVPGNLDHNHSVYLLLSQAVQQILQTFLKYGHSTIAVTEFMILPVGAPTFKEALRWCAEVFHALKVILHDRGLVIAVGDEDGFAPAFEGTEDGVEAILEAIKKAGLEPGKDVFLGFAFASSEFYDKEKKVYDYTKFEGDHDKVRTAEEQVDYLEELVNKYPIISIEDGMDENDWDGWKLLTDRLGDKVQLVGDDLLVTNTKKLSEAIEKGISNSILIKVNQIGTLTETFDAIEMAKRAGYTAVISHRSGETEDSTIADIAVATNAGQIKTGSLSRTDRIAKYNQLLRIEDMLGDVALYDGEEVFYNLH